MLLSLTAQRPHVRSKWALPLWLEDLTNSHFVLSTISFSHKKVSKTKWCAVSLTLVWSTWQWRIWEYLRSSVGHREWPVSQQYSSFPSIPSSKWKVLRKGKCHNFGFLYTVMGNMSTQPFHLYSAAQNTCRNLQRNVWNWMNNYSMCIHAKLLLSYTLYYWQYNIILHIKI